MNSATHSIYKYRGNVMGVRNYTDSLHALVRTHGFPFWEPVVEVNAGWVLSEQGQMPEAIERIRQSVTLRQRLGTTLRQPYYHAVLAEVYGKTGQRADGIQLLDEALTVANNSDERNWEAEIYRGKGELLLNAERRMRNDERKTKKKERATSPIQHSSFSVHRSEEAEACFRKAIDIARQQQAKSLELRATMSLVRLRQQQVMQYAIRRTNHATRSALAQAHKILSEAYNWFTEGFDTKDLQEAKLLLQELR